MSITIPNSVTSIGSWSFQGCRGLTSITIPNSVTRIEQNVFFGCSGLKDIYFKGTKAQLNAAISNGNGWDVIAIGINYTIHYNA